MQLVIATAALAALFISPANAQPSKRSGVDVSIVKEDSESISAYLFEALEETYTSECYFGPDYDEPEPCEESCGGTNYDVNAYVMVGEKQEISLSASYSNYCEGDGVYWMACATVKVPPAVWKQEDKSASVKVKGTLGDCGYYSEDGSAPTGTNPLLGTVMDVDLSIACDILEESDSRCSYRYSDASIASRSRNVYQSTNCSKEKVKGLKVNGKDMTWDYANFGTWKSRDLYVEYSRNRQRRNRGL